MSALTQQITAVTNQAVSDIRPLHGGMIGEVYIVTLADGDKHVAKTARSAAAMLEREGYMLRYLRDHSDAPVPEVIHSDHTLLLMTFIQGNSHFDARTQAHAAEVLATLHSVRADRFGLERDTLIGGLHQPNTPTDQWLDFFREHRLLYMARTAHDAGRLPTATLKRVEKLAAKLDQFVSEPKHPALIHGDLWTTNMLAHNGRVTALIDPAIYYAHPEIELAYTTLFGIFGEPFFRRYHEISPIADGFFEQRRDLYNLYPLLVHVRLFGGSYVGSVNRTLSKFGV